MALHRESAPCCRTDEGWSYFLHHDYMDLTYKIKFLEDDDVYPAVFEPSKADRFLCLCAGLKKKHVQKNHIFGNYHQEWMIVNNTAYLLKEWVQ